MLSCRLLIAIEKCILVSMLKVGFRILFIWEDGGQQKADEKPFA